jgi:hypothetical protein
VETLPIKACDVDAIDVHPQKAVLRLDDLTDNRAGETFSGVEISGYEAACWLVWVERAGGDA